MRWPWPNDHPDRDAGGEVEPCVPSEEATDRLAGRLRQEIDDLHADLADDLLLTFLLLGEDEGEDAVDVLDHGAERLHRFQDRLEDVIADAAVEREAEAVLASVSVDAAPVPEADTAGERTAVGAFRIRALASAAAALLAAVVGLVSLEAGPAPDAVTARSSSSPADEGSSAAQASAPGASLLGTSDRSSETASAAPSSPRQRLGILIGQQSELIARLGNEPRRSAVAELFGVDRLVAQLATDAAKVPETIESVIPSVTVPDLLDPSEDTTEQPADEQAEPQATTEPGPTEGTGDEPAPAPSESGSEPDSSEEPSEKPSDEAADEPSDDPSSEMVPGGTSQVGGSGSDGTAPSQLLP